MAMKRILLRLVVCALAVGASTCGTPPSRKIIFVGLDGLTWRFLGPLLKDHRLPNFERILDGAASGELETFRPTRSGILWTSVATGKTMAKHGVTDWTFVDEDAREEIERLRLVTGTDRTAAAIWEILSDKGRSVGVTNWWVTYPARPLNGFMITDRLKVVINKKSVAEEPDLVYPASLLDELRPMFVSQSVAVRTMRKFGFPTYGRSKAQQMFATSEASRYLYSFLHTYVGQDQMVASWALHLLDKGQPDFFATIIRIPDVYAHFAWRFADRAVLERIVPQVGVETLTSADRAVRETALGQVAELDQAVAGAMLPAYKFADEFLGSIVSKMGPDTTLMIVSDHGFIWHGGAYDHNPTSHGDYPPASPPGVIILKGKGIRAGTIKGARLFDVTPTILYAMGEPLARDMDGRALTEAFSEAPPRMRDEQWVRTYGTGTKPAKDRAPSREAEQEMLDDLRTLGYIGGSSSPKRGDSKPAAPPEAGDAPRR
jgi:hypothetical protein